MFHGEEGLDSIFNDSPKFEEDHSTKGEFVKKQIGIAKGSLILDQPFFGYLLGQFTIVPVKEGVLKFAVDQSFLYVNTDYMDDLLKAPQWKGELKGILIHLLIHIIFRHHKRSKGTIPNIWAVAADIVVFTYLTNIKNDWKMPQDWKLPNIDTIPPRLQNHTVEETYNLLIEEMEEENEENKGRRADSTDDNEETHPNFEEFKLGQVETKIEQLGLTTIKCDIEEIVLEINSNTSQDELEEQYFEGMLRTAYEHQKGFGSLPEGLERFIQLRLNPTINWKSTLSRYLQQSIIHDLSWSRPNKRLLNQGYYLPGPLKENTTVILAVDTSGSIEDSHLYQFMSEIQAILQSITNIKLVVIDCDAEIQQIRIYEAGESISGHSFLGGGGTDFRPVFNSVKSYNADVLVYITDGNGIFPTKMPDIPVIWILTKDCHLPFGSKILLEEKYPHSLTS